MIAGRLAIGSDPLGAVFGIWQAADPPGHRLHGVPGTPVWNELLTQDTSTVGKFYETRLRLRGESRPASDDFDYVTLHLEGRPVAAVHGVGRSLPRDRGPHWMTYFEVEDTDEAAGPGRPSSAATSSTRPTRARAGGWPRSRTRRARSSPSYGHGPERGRRGLT